MAEVYTRKIKGITGNGTLNVKIEPSLGKRLHSLLLLIVTTGGTNTVTALATAITEIRVLVGTNIRRRISGTVLRDYLILNGVTGAAVSPFDWTTVPNTGTNLEIPFAEEWFIANVADALAWNPAILGAPITVEIDFAGVTTATVTAYERVSDDLDAPSAGIITWETIKPVAGGTEFFVEKEVAPRGKLLQASIYSDGGTLTAAGLMVGQNGVYAHELLSLATNKDFILRSGNMCSVATNRTASIYDMVFVRGDALHHAIDLEKWGKAKFQLQSASFSGSTSIMLARLENK
jgi:hypothetical protein